MTKLAHIVVVVLLLLLLLSPADSFLPASSSTTKHYLASGAPFSTPLLESLSSSSFASAGTPVQQDAIIPPATLTIIIPAYDEANRIVKTLETYTAYIEGNNHTLLQNIDVLVVDDGSTDNTAEIVLDVARCSSMATNIRCMSLSTNVGKGEAVARGVQELVRQRNAGIENMDTCNGSLILVADADGSGDISSCLNEMVGSLVNIIMSERQPRQRQQQQQQQLNETHTVQSHALICGNRGYDGAGIVRSILRWGFRTAVKLICGNLGVSDTQCGMKLMTLDTATVLYSNLNLKRWTHDVEVLYRARTMGIPVAEVPVIWKDEEGSKLVTSAGGAVGASASMLLEILRMRIEYSVGRWQV